MIIMAIFLMGVLIGVFAIGLGLWCIISDRDKEYKKKRDLFMKKKWQVQNYIDEHKGKMKEWM